MGKKLEAINARMSHYGVYAVLHVIILLVSAFLVVCISIDTFKNLAFYEQSEFMHLQPWICLLFLADFFIEFFLSPHKGRFLATHWAFFLVSVPWLTIITHLNLQLSPVAAYAIQFIPLVRGGYALAIVVGWFTSSRSSSLFFSYLLTLLSTVYFASMAFYLFEHEVNSLVNDYQSALWWAFMDVTTVGSNIVAVTPVGRVLSVVLAALGMMMFPIFTVYVTNKIKSSHDSNDSIMSLHLHDIEMRTRKLEARAAKAVADAEEHEQLAEANMSKVESKANGAETNVPKDSMADGADGGSK